MNIRTLLAAAAVSAIVAAAPAYAQTEDGGITYTNNIDTSVTTDVNYYKLLLVLGGVLVDGHISPDSSAVAVTDAKQVLKDTTVNYREENELNGENGFVSPVFGEGVSEAGQDPNDLLLDGVVQPQIRVGFFAPIINTVNPTDVDGTGNIGLNMAAGYFNMQLNSAALSVSSNSTAGALGGWAECGAGFDGGWDCRVGADVARGSGFCGATACQSSSGAVAGPTRVQSSVSLTA